MWWPPYLLQLCWHVVHQVIPRSPNGSKTSYLTFTAIFVRVDSLTPLIWGWWNIHTFWALFSCLVLRKVEVSSKCSILCRVPTQRTLILRKICYDSRKDYNLHNTWNNSLHTISQPCIYILLVRDNRACHHSCWDTYQTKDIAPSSKLHMGSHLAKQVPWGKHFPQELCMHLQALDPTWKSTQAMKVLRSRHLNNMLFIGSWSLLTADHIHNVMTSWEKSEHLRHIGLGGLLACPAHLPILLEKEKL